MIDIMLINMLNQITQSLLALGLGLSINKYDFNSYLVKRINIHSIAFYSFITAIIFLLSIYQEKSLLYCSPFVVCLSSFFFNLSVPRNFTEVKHSSTITFSNLFFVFIIIFISLLTSLPIQYSKLIFFNNILIFCIQTFFLSFLAIWITNKFISKYLFFTIVSEIIFAIIIFKLSTNYFLYSNILSVIWYGYHIRNTIFSSPFRKDFDILLKNSWALLFLLLITIYICSSNLSFELSVSFLLSIGISIILISLRHIFGRNIYINNIVSTGSLGLSITMQFIIIHDLDAANYYTLFNVGYILLIYQLLVIAKAKTTKSSIPYKSFGYSSPILSNLEKSFLYDDFIINPNQSMLQDYSFAGFAFGEKPTSAARENLQVYNVNDFGIKSGTNIDQTVQIQKVINHVGELGGGIIFFPEGVYHLNKSTDTQYLEINNSNIIISGEKVNDLPRTIFVTHKPTLIGHKNPWLSPFLITYGTKLQLPNLFWGIQFKNRKNIRTQSNSLTDPGSDGTIQSPQFCCKILENAMRGEKTIVVEDAFLLTDTRFILIGMYNTTEDGNLIKELLNRNNIPQEWGTALRAGPEKAPSFQWLVEIDRVNHKNKVRLKQPLRRDILLKFEPEIYFVSMIENVGIQDLVIRSTWNGVFRHHGAPLYFNKLESQIMDYGWNAVNFCRVAHGYMKNVIIQNFTNPIYLQDSRNITIEDIQVTGHDGHQGIKLYGHSSDNLMKNIVFLNHYADMIGGEGNCYGNVFSNIKYLNPENKPTDFDFHGFSEGPFSPPSYTLFENCFGIRGIKASGTIYNQPACALHNVWWNIESDGYDDSTEIFKHDQYKNKSLFRSNISAMYRSVIYCLQKKQFSPNIFFLAFSTKKKEIKRTSLKREQHYKLFKNSIIVGYRNNYTLTVANNSEGFKNDFVHIEALNNKVNYPYSLYSEQLRKRNNSNQ